MNERIRELAEQAGLKWKIQPPHYTNTNNPIDFPVSANRDLEKFAELIVKRCLELCDKEHAGSIHTHAGAWNTAIKRCKESIEIHFGVEE